MVRRPVRQVFRRSLGDSGGAAVPDRGTVDCAEQAVELLFHLVLDRLAAFDDARGAAEIEDVDPDRSGADG